MITAAVTVFQFQGCGSEHPGLSRLLNRMEPSLMLLVALVPFLQDKMYLGKGPKASFMMMLEMNLRSVTISLPH